MQKTVVSRHIAQTRIEPTAGWLNLEDIATVEVTSEDPEFPIEGALSLTGGKGWRAAEGGEQQIRLLFAQPIAVRRIQLRFEETGRERTQQFTLRSSAAPDGAGNEILRQQWNFSPSGSTTEIEDLTVDLSRVAKLELTIKPDIGGRDAIATLASMRLA